MELRGFLGLRDESLFKQGIFCDGVIEMVWNELIDLLGNDMSFFETGDFLSDIEINDINNFFMLIEVVSDKVNECLFRLIIELRCDFDD